MLLYHGKLDAAIHIRIFNNLDGGSALEFDGSRAKLPPGRYQVICDNCGDCTVRVTIETSRAKKTALIARGNQARRKLVIKKGDRSLAISVMTMPSVKIKITQ